jgi:alkanesulfonate monooxygenase SsuD/methylene tetrahydromethanopterin reductase-like flavin-dependent oxidoreductase (luciferase family)
MSGAAAAMPDLRVGVMRPTLGPEESWSRGDELAALERAEVDHAVTADHVSFLAGAGLDGLIDAAGLLAAGSLPVYVALYLLPLRHPLLVARQLATLAEAAPGRLVLGVGIGGEDRHEVEVCGVDPRTRGRRMDECLTVLRGLFEGTPLTHRGEFFDLEDALVLPAPAPAVPLVVGGRSEAALSRAARLGDGWLGIWVSARRYAAAVQRIGELADEAGRDGVVWRHGLNVWCGLAEDARSGREQVAAAMQAMYGLPFETFERWSPYGTAEGVATFLAPYVDAGVRDLNLICPGADRAEVLERVAEVRKLLLGTAASR